MPSRKVIRSFQHETDVHKLSMGTRVGYPHVIVPDPPAEFSRSSPQYVHAIAASSLAVPSACWFLLKFAASSFSLSEIADRHDLVSCPRRSTPYSVAPAHP